MKTVLREGGLTVPYAKEKETSCKRNGKVRLA